MEPYDWDDWAPIRVRVNDELLYALDGPDTRGVLLVGAAGSGKSVVLRVAMKDLEARGRPVFLISLAALRDPSDLGRVLVTTIEAAGVPDISIPRDAGRVLRSSAGPPILSDVITRVRGIHLTQPVLMLDGLDESPYPLRLGAAIQELSVGLHEWQFVVATRPGVLGSATRFEGFRIMRVGGLDSAEAELLLRERVPALTASAFDAAQAFANGNPLILSLISQQLARDGTFDISGLDLRTILRRTIDQVISTSAEPETLAALLDQIALAGGREEIGRITARSQIPEARVRELLTGARTSALLRYGNDGEVALLHTLVRDVILQRHIFETPFRLSDLEFGSEEAERDQLLDATYIQQSTLKGLLQQRRSIVIGDRGSGKSALFRKLAASGSGHDPYSSVIVCPVGSPTELLQRILDNEKDIDVEILRAAWLTVVAYVIASTLPKSSPKAVRRDARHIRAAFGFADKRRPLPLRLANSMLRPLFGTKLSFAVGPINLEAQLPGGTTKKRGKSLDVQAFIADVDASLDSALTRVVVMFDRIDEVFKYDRTRQEALVQALLQAEGKISLCRRVSLLLFLRRDLFELFDIQEKTKLVSRTAILDWSPDEWLELLVKRILSNSPLDALSRRLGSLDEQNGISGAIEVLFPETIEDQPVEAWLIEAVRNGNGDLSPRLAILLLYLARDLSPLPDTIVSALPLFSPEVLANAMTKLSDLSYAEVVNDFKVARSFVLNCRAGKVATFSLSDVQGLFDPTDGTISEQVGLLERLGFLERVVVQEDSGPQSRFRIPKLYTRCWDY